MKYEQMTREQLKELAKEKYKNGKFTKTAIAAQRELYNRSHWDIEERYVFDNGYIERDIVDVQYNG